MEAEMNALLHQQHPSAADRNGSPVSHHQHHSQQQQQQQLQQHHHQHQQHQHHQHHQQQQQLQHQEQQQNHHQQMIATSQHHSVPHHLLQSHQQQQAQAHQAMPGSPQLQMHLDDGSGGGTPGQHSGQIILTDSEKRKRKPSQHPSPSWKDNDWALTRRLLNILMNPLYDILRRSLWPKNGELPVGGSKIEHQTELAKLCLIGDGNGGANTSNGIGGAGDDGDGFEGWEHSQEVELEPRWYGNRVKDWMHKLPKIYSDIEADLQSAASDKGLSSIDDLFTVGLPGALDEKLNARCPVFRELRHLLDNAAPTANQMQQQYSITSSSSPMNLSQLPALPNSSPRIYRLPNNNNHEHHEHHGGNNSKQNLSGSVVGSLSIDPFLTSNSGGHISGHNPLGVHSSRIYDGDMNGSPSTPANASGLKDSSSGGPSTSAIDWSQSHGKSLIDPSLTAASIGADGSLDGSVNHNGRRLNSTGQDISTSPITPIASGKKGRSSSKKKSSLARSTSAAATTAINNNKNTKSNSHVPNPSASFLAFHTSASPDHTSSNESSPANGKLTIQGGEVSLGGTDQHRSKRARFDIESLQIQQEHERILKKDQMEHEKLMAELKEEGYKAEREERAKEREFELIKMKLQLEIVQAQAQSPATSSLSPNLDGTTRSAPHNVTTLTSSSSALTSEAPKLSTVASVAPISTIASNSTDFAATGGGGSTATSVGPTSAGPTSAAGGPLRTSPRKQT